MKRMMTVGITIGALLLLGAGMASAQISGQSSGQSLGDAARAARKKKAQSEPAAKQYDNDNLPTTETLSVVGPAPSTPTAGTQQVPAQQAAQQEAQAKAAAAEQHQQAADDMQKKIDAQKEKIDQLAHELDLDQREYRLRAAAMYSDAGNRLRNAAQWDKDDAHYKTELESKEKALDEAKAQLAELQEQARKVGVKEKDTESPEKQK